MKFFVYFHFYVLSFGDSTQVFNTGTAIWAKNDSLTFYVYNVGYIRWKVDAMVKENIDQLRQYSYIVYAKYIVSYKGIVAIVNIKRKEAEISILTGNLPFIIKLYK